MERFAGTISDAFRTHGRTYLFIRNDDFAADVNLCPGDAIVVRVSEHVVFGGRIAGIELGHDEHGGVVGVMTEPAVSVDVVGSLIQSDQCAGQLYLVFDDPK